MRFKRKPMPQHLEERIKRKFLWLPLEIDNEVRWLEYANVKQIYIRCLMYAWRNQEWIN